MADPLDFDVTGARNVGFSDAAIADYLATKAGYDVAGARKAGFGDADIIGHLVPPPKAAEAEPEPASPPKKATVGDDINRVWQSAVSQFHTLGADASAQRLSDIEAARKKADASEYLTPWEKKTVANYDEAKAEAISSLSDRLSRAAQRQEKADALPISPGYKAFREAQGLEAKVDALWKAPGEILTSLFVEGTAGSVPMLAAGMVGGVGPAAVVGGGQAYLQAYAGKVVELLGKRGIDIKDRDAVMAALSDPGTAREIRTDAGLSAIPQAAAAYLAAPLAVRTMAPASMASTPVRQQAVNIPAQAAAQSALGAAGEAGSQAIIGEDLDAGKIFEAGLGEAVGAPGDVATFAARRALGLDAPAQRRRETTPDQVADTVMQAKTVGDAIAAAREVVDRGDLQAEAARLRASEVPADQAQGDILSLYAGLNEGEISRSPDGTYQYTKDGTTTPIREWDGVERQDTIPKALADAQRAAYEAQGVRVIHIDDIGQQVPFDGAVDPNQPNTIFLSTDPQRNAAMVGGHELVHIAEQTALPDGRRLADEYFDLIQKNVTNTGLRQAYEVHGKTAPERSAFPDGPEGDSRHIDAVFNHLIRELGADTGGEAPKFAGYTERVVSAVETRYGEVAAKDVLQKLMDGIRQAMDRLREFFFKPGEIGPPNTVSQHWLTNLGAVHAKLAEMEALRYGEKAGLEEARATSGVHVAGAPQPPTPRPARASVTYGEPEPPSVGSPGPAPNSAYVEAGTRVDTLQRWLTDLDEQRRAAAADSPQARFLQQNIDAILKKVNGVEDRLTKAAAGRLAKARDQLDELLNPTADSPDMARARQALQLEQQRLADSAAVRPREVEQPPDRPTEVVSEAVRDPEQTFDSMATAAESPRVEDGMAFSPRLRPRAWVEFGRKIADAVIGRLLPNTTLTLGRTSEPLRLAGAPDLPLVMQARTVLKAVRDKHVVPQAVLERLPDLIERPAAVFDSATERGALVVLLDAKDRNGDPVIAAVHLAGDRIIVNRVASVYGKQRSTDWLQEQVRAGRLRYLDTEKSRGLSATASSGGSAEAASGLQLPRGDSLRGTASPGSERKIFTESDLVKASPAHFIGNEESLPVQQSALVGKTGEHQTGRAPDPNKAGGRVGDTPDVGLVDSTRKPRFSPRQYGIPADTTTITTFKSDEGIRAHRDYKAAKAGDPAVAARLVSALVRPEQVEMARTRFGPDALYVPVVAEEAAGHNAIPEMLAVYYSEVTGADVARSIRQTVRAFHTGADAMGRLIARPEFEGPVEHGRSYVVVDDVSVLGGTLAELANHIQAGGGRIVGVVTLVNASFSGQYAPRRGHVTLIERRFGNEIREAFGVEPSALTADEVQYLVNFKDLDALRARRANAESEREHRLRQKGVLPSETQAEVRERGVKPDDKPQFSPRVAVDFEALAPKGTSIQGLRHLGTAAYNKLRSTEVHNGPTGQVIKFDGTGHRKTIVGAGEDLLRLVPALPELLRVAVPIGKPAPDARGRPDILAFHKLSATVETDGRTFGVILAVREMRDGTFRYALHKDDGREPGALPGSEDKGEPRSSPLDGAARSAGNIASERPPGKGEGPDGLIIVPHDLPSKPMFSPRSTGENRTHDDTAELRQAYGNAGMPTPKAQRPVVDEARVRIEARQRRYDQLDQPRRPDTEAAQPAEATPILERTAHAEGQPLFSPRQDRDTFAAEIMLDLATVDEMFRYPRTKASTPEAALRDVSPDIQFKGDATRPDEQQESGADRRLMFRTQRGHDFYLYENDGTFWIDVSRLDEGENGSAIYAALMDWAANTDRKFIGDPVHLSNIALRRRTDAMLSSALKHRSTDHMEPHPRQLAGDESLGVPPLVWSHGDTLGNTQNLIDVSWASLAAKVPELKNARFDVDTQTFRTGEGERLSDETFQKWANSLGRDRAAGAGSATLKRAILLNSLLRAEGGSRPKLQAISLRGWSEPVPAAARGILYSPRETGNPDRRLAANLQGAEGLPVQRLPPRHYIGERRTGAALVVDTEKDASDRGDDSFDIVPRDLPRKPMFSPRLSEQDLERARETIDNVVEARRRGEVGTPAKSFGRVTPWLANLARKHGLEVAGYEHAIDVSAVRHIQNRHTNAAIELSRGQAPVRPQDLRLIPDILAAPDYLAFGDRTRRGFDTIGYGKKFSDGSLLYFEQRLSGKRKLAAVSLWRYPAGTHADQIKYSLTHHARSDGGAAIKIVAVDDQSSALQLPGPDDRPSFSPRFTEADLVKAVPAHSIGNEERPSGQRPAPIDATRKPQFSPRQYGIPADAPTITTFKSDEGIKAHRDYKAAKSGDRAAAARLVSGLVRPEQVETALAKFGPDILYVPVVAEEATGHNAIPEFLARYYAEVTGADVARGIRQTVRVFHTGADAMGRLIARPEFEGPVEHGRSYVIVDDVSVLGGTLAELANHIQAGGGHIAGVVTLVNASRSGQYAPRRGHVALIERRFGNEIREAFGVEPSALTADEVQYLVNFKDADALRARRANAESERERRLREKGVLPSEAQAKVRERGVEPDDKPQFSPRQDRRAPGFYSALTRAVENLKVEEMVPDQWRRTIQNLQGVKAAELRWVGLDDWLVERANRPSNGKPSSEKPITKQEILDFLQAHEIQVMEIEKGGGSPTRFKGKYRLSGGKGYRELLLLLPERAGDEPFESDHWTERNVLAHVRFDQRAGSHGERLLHVAEVQSDWHQGDRDQGYRPRTTSEIDKERRAVTAELLRKVPGLDIKNRPELDSALEANPDLWERLFDLQEERQKPPHSPFEKAWPELTMKRIIRYAAEHGYDRVTWDTGATTVKRYNLRRKLAKLHYGIDDSDGRFRIITKHRGGGIIQIRALEQDKLVDKLSRLVGRDLAERIARGEGSPSQRHAWAKDIPGDGRLVGGHEMIGLYDDVLPNVVRKLGRRFGAEVADSWVENRNGRRIPVHGIDITPEMRQRVIEHGWPYLSPRQVADRPSQRAERNSSAAGRPLEPGMNRGIRIVTGSLEPSDEPERDLEDEQRRVRAMYFDALKRRAAQSLSVME